MISIIIPTYNERENIRKLVPDILSVLAKSRLRGEIIIVDDNSPDGTGKEADRLAGTRKFRGKIRVIHRKGKLGLSSAVLAGFKIARGEIIGVMDADLSHPAEKIPEIVGALKGAELAIGSRYVAGGGIKKWPLERRVVSRTAILLARGLTDAKDPVSGFFFLRKNVIREAELNPRGYKIGLEIIVKGRYSRLAEVPYRFSERRRGRSKMSAGEVINYMLHLFSLYRHRLARASRMRDKKQGAGNAQKTARKASLIFLSLC